MKKRLRELKFCWVECDCKVVVKDIELLTVKLSTELQARVNKENALTLC